MLNALLAFSMIPRLPGAESVYLFLEFTIIVVSPLRSIVTTLNEGLLLTTILLHRYQNRFLKFYQRQRVFRLLVKS